MAEGDIGVVVDTLEFDTQNCMRPNIVHVSGNVYAIAYSGYSSDGFVVTVTINTDGQIDDAIIDSFEFEDYSCGEPSIMHISGNIFAVAYTKSQQYVFVNHGYVRTFAIAANGTITKSIIDSLEFNAVNARYSKMIHVSGNVYAIAYKGTATDGYITTVNINPDGQIDNTVIDSWEFDNVNANFPDIIHVSGDVFAIAYQGSGGDGWLVTLSIATDGAITKSIIDSLEFDSVFGVEAEIVHVSGDIYAIGYQSSGEDGAITTVTIATNGSINNTVTDSWIFDAVNGNDINVIHISGNVYGIVYQGPGDDGWTGTFTVASDGTITKSWISTLEFDTGGCYYPDTIHISGNIYAIAYVGAGTDGFLKTVSIETIEVSETKIKKHWHRVGLNMRRF